MRQDGGSCSNQTSSDKNLDDGDGDGSCGGDRISLYYTWLWGRYPQQLEYNGVTTVT
jgi:hypothetical protein